MIQSADDIIAALRNIIADYEQRSANLSIADRAAPVAQTRPPDPSTGAATIYVEDMTPSIEDRARKMASRGRQPFLDWYGKLSDDQRKLVQAISGEIRELFPK